MCLKYLIRWRAITKKLTYFLLCKRNMLWFTIEYKYHVLRTQQKYGKLPRGASYTPTDKAFKMFMLVLDTYCILTVSASFCLVIWFSALLWSVWPCLSTYLVSSLLRLNQDETLIPITLWFSYCILIFREGPFLVYIGKYLLKPGAFSEGGGGGAGADAPPAPPPPTMSKKDM